MNQAAEARLLARAHIARELIADQVTDPSEALELLSYVVAPSPRVRRWERRVPEFTVWARARAWRQAA